MKALVGAFWLWKLQYNVVMYICKFVGQFIVGEQMQKDPEGSSKAQWAANITIQILRIYYSIDVKIERIYFG